jgi:hypothetical protein
VCKIVITICEGDDMSKLQITITGAIVAAENPFAASTLADDVGNLDVGVALGPLALSTLSGGVPPYSVALDPTSGPLPSGTTLDLDSATGTVVELSGTPDTIEAIDFIALAQDSAGGAVKVPVGRGVVSKVPLKPAGTATRNAPAKPAPIPSGPPKETIVNGKVVREL